MMNDKGFTLTELMIVVAIIGILAAMTVPNFITYRNKSRVTAVVGTGEAIRAAFASYASDSTHNHYPPAIADLTALQSVVNAHGGSLGNTLPFTVNHYSFFDSDGDNQQDSYSMRLNVGGVPASTPGFEVLITPQGIFKCTVAGSPC